MHVFHRIILTGLLLIGPVNGYAVSQQTDSVPTYNYETIKSFAKKVERTAAEKQAHVFLLARIGRPRNELPRGINYTHVGIAMYSMIQLDDGRQVPGYAIYSLYQDDNEPDKSDLHVDFPMQFFSGVYELKAGIIIPNQELQRRLHKVVLSDAYKKLHNPKYSAISNPFDASFQNCTEHTLDLIQAAIYNTDDIRTIKARNQQYFQPQKVRVNPFKLLFGSLFSSDIALSDHVDKDVETATFTTLGRYLQDYELLDDWITVTPD